MLFAQKLLAPGLQPKHPGTDNPPSAIGGDPRQSRGFTLRELLPTNSLGDRGWDRYNEI
jgi:hypothetical protein